MFWNAIAQIALKWGGRGLAAIGIGTAAEVLTNKNDGTGGILTGGVRTAGETVVAEQSNLQGLNASIDAQNRATAMQNGMVGGIADFCRFLAFLGFKPAQGWADSLDKYAHNQEDRIRDRTNQFRQRTPGVDVVGSVEAMVPNILDGGNRTAAVLETAALAGVGIYGTKKFLGGVKTPELVPGIVEATTARSMTAAEIATAAKGTEKIVAAETAAKMATVAKGAETIVVAETAAVKSAGWLSRLPVVGKYLAGAAIVGGTGLALLNSSPAEAATTGDNTNPTRDLGATTAALGLSIVAPKATAVLAAEALAPAAASLGLKAIPGVASVVAAGEGIYNTTNYALKGEWSKAGLSLVSGVGETVAGLGGVLTYTTLGTAWREAVREGGALAFGEENTIDHSSVVQAGSWLINQFKGAADPAPTPTSVALVNRQQPLWDFAPAM